MIALACRLMLIAAIVLVTLGGGILLHAYTLPVLAVLCFLAWPRVRAWQGWSHGTARLSTWHDLMRRGLLGHDGLVIGRASLVDPPTRWQAVVGGLLSPVTGSARAVRMMVAAFWRGYDDSLIRVRDCVHAITFAPTGAGKAICVQIQNLFMYGGSMVVVDPQGTLFKVTAWFRQHVLGHKIIKMDALGSTGPAAESDCLNLFDFIDPDSETFIDEIRAFMEVLVKREPNEFQPHFNDMALIFLAAVSSFICKCEPDPAKRTLGLLHDLLASREKFGEVKAAMKAEPGPIGKLGEMLDIPADRELAAILATVARHLAFLQSPPIAEHLSRSTWDPRWLRSGKVTAYLILPSPKLSSLSPLMRLYIGGILHIITKQGASEKNKILFMIDEAAHIGKIQTLEDAFSLYRAYGVRIWLFMQSVNQLQKVFGDNAQTILDNCSLQQFFGTVAFESADHISKRVGDYTILVESINRNIGRTRPGWGGRDPQPGSVSTGSGTTLGEAGRRLLRPEEILALSDRVCINFFKNMNPIISELVPYFRDPLFKNPRHRIRPRGVGPGSVAFSAAVLVLAFAALLLAACVPVPVPSRPGGGPPPYGEARPSEDGFDFSPSYRLPPPPLPPGGRYYP